MGDRADRPRFFAVRDAAWARLVRRAQGPQSSRGLTHAAARYLAARDRFARPETPLPLPGPGMRATELCALADAAEARGDAHAAQRALRRALLARPAERWMDYVAVYDAVAARQPIDERVDALCDLAALFREHRGLPRAGAEAPRLTLEMATLMVQVGAERAAVDLLDGTDGATLAERFWWRLDAAEAMLGLGKMDLAARFARRALRAAGRGRPPEQARSVLREAAGAVKGRTGIGRTPQDAALAWLNAYREGRFEDLYDLYHPACSERTRYRNREHYGRTVRRAAGVLGIKPGAPRLEILREGAFETLLFATQAVRRAPGERSHVLCWQLELARTVAGWRVRRCRSAVGRGPAVDPRDPDVFRGVEWEG